MGRLYLVVSPGSRRNDLERQSDGVIRASVTAHPADGKANRALLTLLAQHLQVPKSTISITHGATSRHKVVDVAGMSDDEIVARLNHTESES